MCTGLKLVCDDGAVICGRTAEFGLELDLHIGFVPAGVPMEASVGSQRGMQWTTSHAAVGIQCFDNPSVIDGINDAGLTVAGFYFSRYAGYAPTEGLDTQKALSPIDFSGWALGTCATTAELRAALEGVTVADVAVEGWGPDAPPFHWIAYDPDGTAIVIEPLAGKLVVSDNPIGAMANSPDFDFQLKNLANYLNVRATNVGTSDAFGVSVAASSQGTGGLGLPGDGTSPSRFVRAAFFSASHTPPPTATDGVQEVFHLLNQFDIPIGSVQAVAADGTGVAEWTLATCVRNAAAGEYYWRTYGDQSLRMVSLGALVDRHDTTVRMGAGPSTGAVTPVSDATANLA